MFFTYGQKRDTIMPHHHEAFEHHEHHDSMVNCRLCSSPYSHAENPSRFGICENCGYKILIVLIVLMVISSYIAWIGIL